MNLKAGFSKICINPPLGSPISGYYMPRFTKGVLDDIYARATAFDDGENKAVIVTLELCLLTAEQMNFRMMVWSLLPLLPKLKKSSIFQTVLISLQVRHIPRAATKQRHHR